VAALAARAADSRAQIIVFPEAFVGGYPKGIDFGTRVGGRKPEGRVWFRRYHEGAIDVPGPEAERIGEIARTHSAWLVIGVIERDHGTLYCTALYFAPDGSLAGKHRKIMPTAMERIIWGFGDGTTLPVIPTPIGRLGAVICWENYMPLMRMAMYSKGIELYCAPTVDDRETWAVSMRHIAVEGRCFVLSACQFARRADYPDDYPCDGDILIRGGSSIVAPLGRELAGPVYDRDEILTAELNLDEIPEGKFDLDVAGHYSRPDVFKFSINE
jgi:nitrilase